MRLYLVAGEASGDARGAELMRSLREVDSSCAFFGAGGSDLDPLADANFVFVWK